jgi:hypothetical protein
MMHDIETIKELSIWMINTYVRNKDKAMNEHGYCDWDWMAAEVWATYPGIVNEFLINEAIDLILEAAEETN